MKNYALSKPFYLRSFEAELKKKAIAAKGCTKLKSFSELFALVKNICRENITDVSYNLWLEPVEPLKFENDKAYLYVKESFHKGILTEKYLTMLQSTFKEVMGFDVDVIIYSEEDIAPEKMISDEKAPSEEAIENTRINEELLDKQYEYTFDTFIIGSSNEFAASACRAVAENQNILYSNPLFIHGPSGLGKTHLMMAIMNYIKIHQPEKNIVFASAETFGNELINSLKDKDLRNFHLKYRHADILLIDDVQFLAGKESMQEEFFHTFNELHSQGKQIILTSDRPPKDIKTLSDRLRNRFESGLLADITPPDYEMRIAIIRRKAEIVQINIPSDVTEFIAKKLKSNIRQLEGAVKKLKANKLYTGASPSITIAQNIIRDILNDNQPEPVTIEKIIKECAKTFDVSDEDIVSKKKDAKSSLARQTAIYVVRQVTQMPLESIGQEFGGRNHSTMVYTMSTVSEKIKNDSHYKEIVDDIIKNIKTY